MMRRRLGCWSLWAAFLLVIAACSGDGGGSTTAATSPATTPDTAAPTSTLAATTATLDTGFDIEFDVGVTPAPCGDSVNESNGCIYLGLITDLDLTPGSLARVGVAITQAEEDFWDVVNRGGGVGGFDVIISADNTFDARSDSVQTTAGASALADRVLGLAQSLGTPQTQAALSIYADNDMVAVPATRWSGWAFDEEDRGLIMESGASFCFEAMNGMTYLTNKRGTDFSWALVVFTSDHGDYGDYGAGAKLGAALLGLADPIAEISQLPVSFGGDVAATVATLVATTPDVVVMATGPTEMSQITKGLSDAGHEFEVLGASLTWNVALKGDPDLVPLLEEVYSGTSAWGAWDFNSDGHAAMRAAAEAAGREPDNDYIAGWVSQYPWLTLLTEVVATGDITRSNVAGVAEDLESIDYQGMLPEGSYAGTPHESVARSTIVNRADVRAPDGLTAITDAFVSEIAADFDLGAPCSVGP